MPCDKTASFDFLEVVSENLTKRINHAYEFEKWTKTVFEINILRKEEFDKIS